MRKTVVLDVVGLTSRLVGENTPFLRNWFTAGRIAPVEPVFPAVTCPVQSTYLTGTTPDRHGIVGNGWYFRDECEVKFWRQSNRLVQAPKIWETARALDPSFTCANLFWWYNMYSSVDVSVTPRPMYPADGRKLPDLYTRPADLRFLLQKQLGTFPLFEFWGPRTSIRSSRWIAEAAKLVEAAQNPTLTLIYLPHLDYNLQRHGPGDSSVARDLREIDEVCADLIGFYEDRDAQVILLSEYGITPVDRPVSPNRALREHGYLAVREELGLELLDPGARAAFAVADHQVAHVYLNNPEKLGAVQRLLEGLPGVEAVLARDKKADWHLDHERAGDLVAVAAPGAWFTYYYWLDDQRAPDFARTVDIHRKPGYDPVEMFIDPAIRLPRAKMSAFLLKKRLGFRALLNLVPLDASLPKGSHGRLPDSPAAGPLIATRQAGLLPAGPIPAREVHDVILGHLTGGAVHVTAKSRLSAVERGRRMRTAAP